MRSNPHAELPTHLWKAARGAGALPDYGTDSCAERLTIEIARVLGVETADVELAVRHEERGVVSERIDGELNHGNELLSGIWPEYETEKKGTVPGYDLVSIKAVLDGYRGWSGDLSAFECFAGLLVFDENWAVVQNTQTLAPSFDHGASLGFNATARQMTDPTGYARKVRARHFGRDKSPLEMAREALGMVTPQVSELWIARVAAFETTRIRQIVSAVPTAWMSAPRRTFVAELVEENRRRLLT